MSRKGGAARSNKSRARKQYVDGILSPAELEGLIGTTLKGVLMQKITPGQAQAVASLARAAVAVREASAIEKLQTDVEMIQTALRRGGAA